MATFFGEVLSVYSRAVEEDDDDDEEEQDEEDQLILRELEDKRWVGTAGTAATGCATAQSLFMVGHSDLSCVLCAGFVSVYFLSHGGWDAVGHVSLWNERTVHSEDTTCVLHRHRESHQVLVCQVDCFVAEDQLFQWTEQVLGSLDASQVTVLSDCPAAEYQSPQPLGPDPCLRSLHTSAWSEPICCPPVELPNLVSGLPAAVVSFCQLHNISAAVYQCYSDARSADSTTMDMFRPVVARLAQDLKLDFSPDRDILRKFISQANVQSNLYI
uniref:Proteasome assembly chaperone 1 n=1 Tax=Periophthalmus magnuspinnatus TaxID=409849 RepID=A0A3B3ZY31_9GOBI